MSIELDLDALESEFRGDQRSRGWLQTRGLWLIHRLREVEATVEENDGAIGRLTAKVDLLERQIRLARPIRALEHES